MAKRANLDNLKASQGIYGASPDIYAAPQDIYGARLGIDGARLGTYGSRQDIYGSRQGVDGASWRFDGDALRFGMPHRGIDDPLVCSWNDNSTSAEPSPALPIETCSMFVARSTPLGHRRFCTQG